MRDPLRDKYLELQDEMLKLLIVSARSVRASVAGGVEANKDALRALESFWPRFESKTFVEQTRSNEEELIVLSLQDRERVQMIKARQSLLGDEEGTKLIDITPADDRLWRDVMGD